MYKTIIRPIFFKLDPEVAHNFTFNCLKIAGKIPFVRSIIRKMFAVVDKRLGVRLFGIDFPNRVGLAAGLDKNAEVYKELSSFGFGFIEIGTVTPVGQPGNDKKRLFRLIEDEGIINRMGFNNEGVEAVVKRLRDKGGVIIGGNIGKNKVTPNEKATEDYVNCFNVLFDYVDYFVVNVSSPNTPNLRSLQEKEPLKELLKTLMRENGKKEKAKPILLKIAPDLTEEQLVDIVEIIKETGIQGVIATNTTISRDGLKSEKRVETGGLSGKPLKDRSTEVIRFLKARSGGEFAIIGVGGIQNGEDAVEKLEAGADLVQIYTSFIYEGPSVVRRINKYILEKIGSDKN